MAGIVGVIEIDRTEGPMTSHFRAAVLAVILAGGTLVSYGTAYAVMGPAPAVAASSASAANPAARNVAAGQTDISVREACSGFDRGDARDLCARTMGAASRPVRVIDLASGDTGAVVR